MFPQFGGNSRLTWDEWDRKAEVGSIPSIPPTSFTGVAFNNRAVPPFRPGADDWASTDSEKPTVPFSTTNRVSEVRRKITSFPIARPVDDDGSDSSQWHRLSGVTKAEKSTDTFDLSEKPLMTHQATMTDACLLLNFSLFQPPRKYRGTCESSCGQRCSTSRFSIDDETLSMRRSLSDEESQHFSQKRNAFKTCRVMAGRDHSEDTACLKQNVLDYHGLQRPKEDKKEASVDRIKSPRTKNNQKTSPKKLTGSKEIEVKQKDEEGKDEEESSSTSSETSSSGSSTSSASSSKDEEASSSSESSDATTTAVTPKRSQKPSKPATSASKPSTHNTKVSKPSTHKTKAPKPSNTLKPSKVTANIPKSPKPSNRFSKPVTVPVKDNKKVEAGLLKPGPDKRRSFHQTIGRSKRDQSEGRKSLIPWYTDTLATTDFESVPSRFSASGSDKKQKNRLKQKLVSNGLKDPDGTPPGIQYKQINSKTSCSDNNSEVYAWDPMECVPLRTAKETGKSLESSKALDDSCPTLARKEVRRLAGENKLWRESHFQSDGSGGKKIVSEPKFGRGDSCLGSAGRSMRLSKRSPFGMGDGDSEDAGGPGNSDTTLLQRYRFQRRQQY